MTPRPDLNKLAKEVFEQNKLKGWHDKEYSNEHYLCLVISELMEAVEADRKGRRANMKLYFHELKCYEIAYPKKDFYITKIFERVFLGCIKDTLEDELADAVIRLLDLVGVRNDNSRYPKEIDLTVTKDRDISLNRAILFTEKVYDITRWLTTQHQNYIGYVQTGIILIESLCKSLQIDLWLHVELKMKYNQTRPIKHGERY